jgi:hypothetical protein
VLSRVFFRGTSVDEIGSIFHRFFLEPWGLPAFAVPRADVVRSLIFMAIALTAHFVGRQGFGVTRLRSPVASGAFWAVAAVVILLAFAPIRSQFIYFQF